MLAAKYFLQKFRSTAHFGKLGQVYRMALGTSHQDLLIGNTWDLTTLAKPCPLNVMVTQTWDFNIANADTLDFIVNDTDDAGVMAHPTRPHSYTKVGLNGEAYGVLRMSSLLRNCNIK